MIFNVSNISPVLFSIGPFDIRWYAIAYILGFVLGWKYCLKIIKNSKERPNAKDFDDLLTWLIVGVILGGRLGYVLFYNLAFYLENPASIFKVWQGGMSFHGGVLGVIASSYLFSRKHNVKFLRITDLVCLAAPIGLFFGRIANFINNELWGKVTNGNWGVVFREGTSLPRHPSQIYEAFLEGVVLFLVLNFIYKKDKTLSHGVISGDFLVGYGLSRLLVEMFREPDAQLGYIFNCLTMGQLLSIPMIGIGMFLIILSSKRKNGNFNK